MNAEEYLLEQKKSLEEEIVKESQNVLEVEKQKLGGVLVDDTLLFQARENIKRKERRKEILEAQIEELKRENQFASSLLGKKGRTKVWAKKRAHGSDSKERTPNSSSSSSNEKENYIVIKNRDSNDIKDEFSSDESSLSQSFKENICAKLPGKLCIPSTYQLPYVQKPYHICTAPGCENHAINSTVWCLFHNGVDRGPYERQEKFWMYFDDLSSFFFEENANSNNTMSFLLNNQM